MRYSKVITTGERINPEDKSQIYIFKDTTDNIRYQINSPCRIGSRLWDKFDLDVQNYDISTFSVRPGLTRRKLGGK